MLRATNDLRSLAQHHRTTQRGLVREGRPVEPRRTRRDTYGAASRSWRVEKVFRRKSRSSTDAAPRRPSRMHSAAGAVSRPACFGATTSGPWRANPEAQLPLDRFESRCAASLCAESGSGPLVEIQCSSVPGISGVARCKVTPTVDYIDSSGRTRGLDR